MQIPNIASYCPILRSRCKRKQQKFDEGTEFLRSTNHLSFDANLSFTSDLVAFLTHRSARHPPLTCVSFICMNQRPYKAFKCDASYICELCHRAFTGEYESNKEPGIYKCIVCGESLFK